MECKALGTVAAEALGDLQERLLGLCGVPGQEVYLQELVLRSSNPDRSELHLQHGSRKAGEPGWWTAAEYRIPLQGRAAADLPATVRSVVRTQCQGPDVPGFWRALGFSLAYQLGKQGTLFHVEHADHQLQVLLCQVRRLSGVWPASVVEGEELVPGFWLVEATTTAKDGAYTEAAAALGSFSKLVSPFTELRPMPAARGRPWPAS